MKMYKPDQITSLNYLKVESAYFKGQVVVD